MSYMNDEIKCDNHKSITSGGRHNYYKKNFISFNKTNINLIYFLKNGKI